MSDISIAAASAGLLGAVLGVATTLYASGRAGGKRDEIIDGHERRINAMRDSVKILERGQAEDRAEMRERFARMESTLESVKEAAEETRGDVRQLAGGKR